LEPASSGTDVGVPPRRHGRSNGTKTERCWERISGETQEVETVQGGRNFLVLSLRLIGRR
jgi:hypothetical protein